MITNPTRQRNLRGHLPGRPTPRAANTTEHQARLAARLTPRDKWIARMLHEHRVLTVHQITTLCFPSSRSGRLRMRELFTWNVVDRFQPFVSVGTAPMHYVLAPAGATVLAGEDGMDVKAWGYKHERAFAIAHSLRLAHTVGVNDWFTALIDRAQHPRGDERAELTAWWPEARCARHYGDLIQPDAYGSWRHHDHLGRTRDVDWFLEYDLGTETLSRLAGKLAGYAALAASTAIVTPVLVWVPTARREATARTLLAAAWRELDDPHTVPVATAAADLLNPTAPHPSPADPVWLPLTRPAAGPAQWGSRLPLHRLLTDAWPHVPAPTTDTSEPAGAGAAVVMPGVRGVLAPPPTPMPPAPSYPRRRTGVVSGA